MPSVTDGGFGTVVLERNCSMATEKSLAVEKKETYRQKNKKHWEIVRRGGEPKCTKEPRCRRKSGCANTGEPGSERASADVLSRKAERQLVVSVRVIEGAATGLGRER